MDFHSIFLALGLAGVAGTLISLRREHIRTEYSVSWLAFSLILTFIALFPAVLGAAAKRFNLDPVLCFLVAGGVLITVLVFEVSHAVSKLRDENVVLAQRLAILDFRLREADKGRGKD